ncbi:MAG TPA: hypothetical protein VLM37_11130 [Fibrobacteraceae bacterium]|nr:hypothetical protein [Fibrobacteraceae bacterium]
MHKLAKLSCVLPFLALVACILAAFASRILPYAWMGILYGLIVFFLLVAGIVSGALGWWFSRKAQQPRDQGLALMGFLMSLAMLAFLGYFSWRAYLQMSLMRQ